MTAKLHLAPITPCCDECVIGALRHAGFNFTQPFLALGLQELAPEERRAAVEQFLLHAPGSVALLVSASEETLEERMEKAAADDDAEATALGEVDLDCSELEGVDVSSEEAFGSTLVMTKTDVYSCDRVKLQTLEGILESDAIDETADH